MNAIARHIARAVIAAALAAVPALAQAACPEGKLADGSCVKPRLGERGEILGTILSQPKISYTAPPVLPSEDRYTAEIPSTHEMLNLFTYPPQTGTITTGSVTVIVGGRPVTRTFQITRP